MKEQHREALKRPNHPTLEDVRLVDLQVHIDNRGWLSELLRADDDHFAGFGQLYLVNNFQSNVVRAFHKHLEQDEWFFVTQGIIQFIFIDERLETSTQGQLNAFVLSGERPQALYVPRGVQHGSMALTSGAQIMAVTNVPYDKANPDEVRLPSDAYGKLWQLGGW